MRAEFSNFRYGYLFRQRIQAPSLLLLLCGLLGWSTRVFQVTFSAVYGRREAIADIWRSGSDLWLPIPSNNNQSHLSTHQAPSLDIFHLTHQYTECQGKEKLLDILKQSGYDEINRETCRVLPTWKQVTDIYYRSGSGPVILGQETCQAYRDMMEQDTMDPMPRVAGLYHSGTNAFCKTLERNLGQIQLPRQEWNGYEVAWGKHIPPKYRFNNSYPVDNSESHQHTLPIVIVRDPFVWMRSMCREGYDAKYLRGKGNRCPFFFRMASDNITNKVTVRAHQTGFKYYDYYDSLADMYSKWHRGYVNASFPRLIIRYEDLLLYPRQLIEAIEECTGKPAKKQFTSFTQEARGFVKKPRKNFLLQALQKLGRRDDMYYTLKLSSRDVAYVLKALDPTLLKLFRYQHVDDPSIPPRPNFTQRLSTLKQWRPPRRRSNDVVARPDLEKLRLQSQHRQTLLQIRLGKLLAAREEKATIHDT